MYIYNYYIYTYIYYKVDLSFPNYPSYHKEPSCS